MDNDMISVPKTTEASLYNVLLEQWKKKNNHRVDSNYSLTREDILELLNPDNYPAYASGKATRNIIIIICYASIVLVSLFGNLLVCYVIFKKKRMRTETNILMANLTASDLIMTVFNIPFNILRLLLDDWPFGNEMCKFVPFIQVTSVYVSTFSMTVIAIDRYQAIIFPFHRRMSNSVPIIVIIALIWFFSSIFSIPYLIYNKVVLISVHKTFHRCRFVYPSPAHTYRQIIAVVTVLTQYIIPLVITSLAYIIISINIWRKMGEESEQQKAREKSRRKSIKMLAIVVIVFTICWLPLNVFHLRADFSTGFIAYDTNIFFICHWFAMSSVCYNPFIYFWLNKHYRHETQNILRCGRFKCFGVPFLESPSSSSPNGNNMIRSNAFRMGPVINKTDNGVVSTKVAIFVKESSV